MIKQKKNRFSAGQFQFKSYVGNKINTYSYARLLSAEAWSKIYSETEHAFRNRVDDQLRPGHGLWQGEFWGKHILSAISALQYYDEDIALIENLKKAASGLIATQDENGYIGTYKDSSFLQGDTWNIWCRKYTLWGLVELYKLLHDDSILKAAEKFLDHIISEVGPGKTSIVETGNFYGLPSTSILQPVVEMYRITEKQIYLVFAKYIVEQWGQHPEGIPNLLKMGLENKPVHQWFEDPNKWAKGYEFLSCVEGLLELYRIDGNEDYLTAVINIHEQLLRWEQSFIGSISFDDKLMGAKYFKNTFSEICDNIYWNRLNYSLYCLTGDAKYADLFENTFYNGLLVGMKTDGSWGLRRQRVSHEHIPASPHCFLKHHQCCTTNLPRGFFQAGELAVVADASGLCVALYSAGEGSVKLSDGRVAKVAVLGDYPFESKIQIKITTSDGKLCSLKLRKPSWCEKMSLRIKDNLLACAEVDQWLVLDSAWTSGEVISVDFGQMLRVKYFTNNTEAHEEKMLEWHRKMWVKRGFFSEDGRGQISSLTDSDPRGQNPAVSFFLGPLALARDIRLGEEDVFSTIDAGFSLAQKQLSKIDELPIGVERAWSLDLGENKLRLCDYPSAGNTWDKASLFATWVDLS